MPLWWLVVGERSGLAGLGADESGKRSGEGLLGDGDLLSALPFTSAPKHTQINTTPRNPSKHMLLLSLKIREQNRTSKTNAHT